MSQFTFLLDGYYSCGEWIGTWRKPEADPGQKVGTVVQVRANSDTGGVAWIDQTNHRLQL